MYRDPLEDFYTHSEKTVRKYSVYQAVQSAKARLPAQISLCVNAISGMAYSTKITLQQMNRLADEMVADSRYYAQ